MKSKGLGNSRQALPGSREHPNESKHLKTKTKQQKVCFNPRRIFLSSQHSGSKNVDIFCFPVCSRDLFQAIYNHVDRSFKTYMHTHTQPHSKKHTYNSPPHIPQCLRESIVMVKDHNQRQARRKVFICLRFSHCSSSL